MPNRPLKLFSALIIISVSICPAMQPKDSSTGISLKNNIQTTRNDVSFQHIDNAFIQNVIDNIDKRKNDMSLDDARKLIIRLRSDSTCYAKQIADIEKKLKYSQMFKLFKEEFDKRNNILDKKLVILVENKEYGSAEAMLQKEIAGGAKRYYEMGILKELQFNYGDAENYFEKSRDIKIGLFGRGNPQVGSTVNNLGAVYKRQGKYEKAIRAFTDAIAMYGPDHPYIAKSYINLAGTYKCLGEYDTAVAYYEKAFKLLQVKYGEKSPDIAILNNNLGITWVSAGDIPKGLKYLNKSLKIWRELQGEKNTNVADVYKNIADAETNRGNYKEANENLYKSRDIWRSLYMEKHHDADTLSDSLSSLR
jgi:tetratricopeptide (TPR) repeat protein